MMRRVEVGTGAVLPCDFVHGWSTSSFWVGVRSHRSVYLEGFLLAECSGRTVPEASREHLLLPYDLRSVDPFQPL